MKISLELWWTLSDILVKGTRELSDVSPPNWRQWSTSGWRSMSNTILEEILKELEIEVEIEE